MTATTFTAGVQASLSPWADPSGAWQVKNAALGAMFDGVWSVVADQGSPDDSGFTAGWSTLLDPDVCPAWALPFCAMFVGANVHPGTDEVTARAQIKSEQGFQRGTAAAIIAAAQRNLYAPRSVVLQERTAANGTADPYHFLLVVKVNEVIDLAALQTAVDAVRPAGVRWTLTVADGYLWDQAVHTWAADTMTWAQAATAQP